MSVDFKDGEIVPGTHYRVVLRIGQGGMGSVFEVEHIELGKRFVLKALLPQFLERKDLVQRLRNEWRSLGKLEHPNIVSVTDAGVARNGVPFYVMERLQGETLASALKSRGHVPLADALRIACEILEGLSAAHEIGVVHRDVKPPNIFLTQGGSAKILDFGIAKLLDGAALELTSKGIAIGTPRYMSPEQAAGETVDGRADLYAVGLLLFEMIAGVGPFDGGDSNEVFLAHLTKVPPRLAALVPGLPPELDGFVALLLAKHPAERPVSASAAAKTMRAILRCVPQLRADTVASPLSVALTPVIPASPIVPRIERPRDGARLEAAKGEPRIFRGIGRPQLSQDSYEDDLSSVPVPVNPGVGRRVHTPAPLGRSPAEAVTLGLASPSAGALAMGLATTFNDAPPTRTSVPLPSTPPPVASSSRPPPWASSQVTPQGIPINQPVWPWVLAVALSVATATGGLVFWLKREPATPSTEAEATQLTNVQDQASLAKGQALQVVPANAAQVHPTPVNAAAQVQAVQVNANPAPALPANAAVQQGAVVGQQGVALQQGAVVGQQGAAQPGALPLMPQNTALGAHGDSARAASEAGAKTGAGRIRSQSATGQVASAPLLNAQNRRGTEASSPAREASVPRAVDAPIPEMPQRVDAPAPNNGAAGTAKSRLPGPGFPTL